MWGPPSTWCTNHHDFRSSKGQSLYFRNPQWVMGVPPLVHPSMCWFMLRWATTSSYSVSIALYLHDLGWLDAFVHIDWSINRLLFVSVVRSCTSEPLVAIFPQQVIYGLSPSHGIWITPRGFEFSLLYHQCISYRLMIIQLWLRYQIFSSHLNNFTMIF